MKQFFSAALSAAMVLAGTSAFAQTATTSTPVNSGATATAPQAGEGGFGHHRHHGHHGDRAQMMAKKLNLSQAQQDQLKPMFENRRTQAKAIWQDTSLTADQKKQKMQALHQESQAQLNGVLTPDQQQQWSQLKAQGKEHMAEARANMGKRFAEKLNLTQAQQDQLQPLMQKNREQAKAIWQDNSLTQDQKKEKMQALHQDAKTQMSAILTPEQQTQMQQMREHGHGRHRHGQGAPSAAPATEQPQSQAPQGS